jgi:hydroxymethylbilane synthase
MSQLQPGLRIGTRQSELALWQARYVQSGLRNHNHESEIVSVKSDGEADTITPLYAMGITGIFTRQLDIALLNSRIDIAVHSLKDVPTRLPEGVLIAAVLARANPMDILIYKDRLPSPDQDYCIATGSLRRQAQWKHRYKKHRVEPIRGNINSRLKKLKDSDKLDGLILAAAGIERIDLDVPNDHLLDWMIPAPGQGALALLCREDDEKSIAIASNLNDQVTNIETDIEREFLRTLAGGCSMPISGFARVIRDQIEFKGGVYREDGSKSIVLNKFFSSDTKNIGKTVAEEILSMGGQAILSKSDERN